MVLTTPSSWLRSDNRVAIMGILNVTPDSFSDGGLFLGVDKALEQARLLIEAGADIVDVGGESTRPGAAPVSRDEERARVIPVIAAIRSRFTVPLSVDTSDPMVMAEAVAAGADFINDVRALTRPGALAAALRLKVPVCLMHSRAEPGTMSKVDEGADVVAEVRTYLAERLATCIAAGFDRRHIVVDPGFGFGKSLAENAALMRALPEFVSLAPVLIGVSRKRMAGEPLGLPVGERLHSSIALALAGVQAGARIVRVHDVRETREAVRMWEWIYEPKERVA